jgi:hypothetical protein
LAARTAKLLRAPAKRTDLLLTLTREGVEGAAIGATGFRQTGCTIVAMVNELLIESRVRKKLA